MLAQVIIRNAGGSQGRSSANINWASKTKAALSKVKTLEDTSTAINDIVEAQDAVFNSQSQRIKKFLNARGYSFEQIQAYLASGLFPFLILKTYTAYLGLLNSIHQEGYVNVRHWQGGLANAMLQHHSKKLMQVQLHAADFKSCVIGTYIHLRDSSAKKFFAEAMTRTLWRESSTLSANAPPFPATGAATGNRSTCIHCRGVGVHTGVTRNHCILKEVPAGIARSTLANVPQTEVTIVAKAFESAVAAARARDASANLQPISDSIRAAFGI